MKEVIDPIYDKYSSLITNCVVVPYEYGQPSTPEEPDVTSDETCDDLRDDLEAFERNCDNSRQEIKVAMYKTDKQISVLLNDDQPISGETEEASTKVEANDDMDSLFDSDEDDNIDCKGNDAEFNGQSSPSSSTDDRKEENKSALADARTFSHAFNKQLCVVNSCVHEFMHTARTLFMLAYDDLNKTDGWDNVTSAVQECVFTDIERGLHVLYR